MTPTPEPSNQALFWDIIDRLVATSEIVIDRPKGSTHPRYPGLIYPLDYGYLAGTTAGDGQGIDVWRGSAAGEGVAGVVATADAFKRDAEVKILLDCTEDEIETITAFLNSGVMGCAVIKRTRAKA
jgi:inorganic pyrophosphatase